MIITINKIHDGLSTNIGMIGVADTGRIISLDIFPKAGQTNPTCVMNHEGILTIRQQLQNIGSHVPTINNLVSGNYSTGAVFSAGLEIVDGGDSKRRIISTTNLHPRIDLAEITFFDQTNLHEKVKLRFAKTYY